MEGALWPSKLIADVLQENGLGSSVWPCIERIQPLRRSSKSAPEHRPNVQEHYETLQVTSDLLHPLEITLVDDVLTKGTTTYACFLRLKERFPDSIIRVFAMFRTLGLVGEIDVVVEPTVGKITHFASGKVYRDP